MGRVGWSSPGPAGGVPKGLQVPTRGFAAVGGPGAVPGTQSAPAAERPLGDGGSRAALPLPLEPGLRALWDSPRHFPAPPHAGFGPRACRSVERPGLRRGTLFAEPGT